MKRPEANARALALEVIHQVFEEGAYANLALDKALFSVPLDDRDRGLATELVYGTVKYRDRLDHILNHYTKRPMAKTTPWLRDILRMAVYQLDRLDKLPPHAVVHEAVALAKQKDRRGDKFVNGVLRSYLRDPEAVRWPDKRKHFAQWLAKTESFPQWMIEDWLRQYGREETETIARYMNRPAELWVRTQTLKTDRTALLAYFENLGIRTEPGRYAPEAIHLFQMNPLREDAAFLDGRYTVQDQSSMLVAHAAMPKAGMKILDACAAPGGKTTHLATLAEDRAEVLAGDVHPHRVALIRENAERLSLTSIRPLVMDATDPKDIEDESLDLILLDAPCSGLGVLNRRPDARWQKRKGDLASLADLQRQMLDRLAPKLAPGGSLLYSTCTTAALENSAQIARFLEDHPTFERSPLPPLLAPLATPEEALGELHLLPSRQGTDGFFIARLTKRRDGA